MYNPYKKLTAQLLLFSFLLESCYNPNIGVSKKMPLTPKEVAYQQHQYKENACSKNLEPSPSLTCTTADGQAITFTHHNESCQAEVCMPNGRRQLPVTFEPGYTIEDLAAKDPTEQQKLIHLCPNRDNKDPIDHIYVGTVPTQAENKEHPQPAEARIQEQAGLQILPSHTQTIPASPNSQSQLQATLTPLPIPSSELFGYNNAHKTPNKTIPSLKNQHVLTHSQRAAQAKRAERITKTKPTGKLAPTTHLKQNTPPTTLPPGSAAKIPQDITSPIFVAQGGQRVHFIHKNDQWQASVMERIGAFSRTEMLPVHCERHGDIAAALQALQGKPDKYVQQRIHVMTARQIPYVPKFVFIGEQGLKGGGEGEASSSREIQGEPPAGAYSGTSGSSQLLTAPQDQEDSLVALLKFMKKKECIITSTETLVNALNDAQETEEQKNLQEWVRTYIEWFNNQNVGNLTQRQGAVIHEYSLLAGIRADNAEQKELLRDYFNSLCNKIGQEYQNGEEPLIQALEQTLQTLDSRVFEGNPHSLIQLGTKLLAKLNPSNHFSKETYPTHRSSLYTLHQVLILIQKIAPNQWDPNQKDGLYSRFKAQLQAIAQSAQYYPVRYQALLLEQVLQLLEKPEATLQEISRRAWHSFRGMIYLYQGLPIPGIDLNTNLEDLEKGFASLRTAFARRGTCWGAWLLALIEKSAPLLSIASPSLDQYQEFEAQLKEFKAKAVSKLNANSSGYMAFRFGTVMQLSKLALECGNDAVRKKSVAWLARLAKPEGWGSYPAVMDGILDSLASVALQGQAEEAQQARSALKKLVHSLPSRLMQARHCLAALAHSLSRRSVAPPERATQRAIEAWLDGKTLEEKLRSMPAPSEPDLADLFSAIKRHVKVGSPQEPAVGYRVSQVNTLFPPPAVSFFVGRAQELETLRQSLQAKQKLIIAPPITGPGGIGKTQLALRVVKQQAEEEEYDHMFWLPAESEKKCIDAYLSLAKGLGIYVEKKKPEQAVKTVRAHLKDKHCLYVFDDAPDIEVIQNFLPVEQGHVLITSRNSSVGAWPTKPLLMNPFGEQEALALAQELGYGQSAQEQEALHSLLEQMPCYPLTLVQLLSTSEEGGWDAAEFLEAMQQYTATRQEQKLINLLDKRPDARVGYGQSMVYVLKTSLERLAKEQYGPAALQLISQLSYLDPKGIPVAWLLTWDTEDVTPWQRKTRAALSLLEKYSLIQWDRPKKQAYIHAETQLMVRHLHPQELLTGLINSLVAYVGAEVEARQNAEKWSSLLPHGRILFERLDVTRFPEAGYLLTKYLSQACHVACLFAEGMRWAEKCLEIAQSCYPDQDHPDIAYALNNLGVSLGELGHHEDALKHKQDGLSMRERLFQEAAHLDVAYSWSDVGSSLSQLGRYQEALDAKQKALSMREHLLQEDHPDIAHALNSIGELLSHLGQHSEALEYKQRSLAMRQRLDPNHPDVARSFNSVGISLEDLGCLEEALAYKRKSLSMRERLAPNHPDVGHSLNNVGDTFMKLGNPKEGVDYCQRGLALRERIYQGQVHPYLVQSLNSLGQGYVALGQYAEALTYYKNAASMALRVYTPKHPRLKQAVHNFIETLNKVDEQSLVQEAKGEVVSLCIQVLGEEHSLTQELVSASSSF